MVVREAGVFWNEETTDGYVNMRAKINDELLPLEEEIKSKRLTWNQEAVRALIPAYRGRKEVDRVLAKVGSDFQYDDTHFVHDEDAPEDVGGSPGQEEPHCWHAEGFGRGTESVEGSCQEGQG